MASGKGGGSESNVNTPHGLRTVGLVSEALLDRCDERGFALRRLRDLPDAHLIHAWRTPATAGPHSRPCSRQRVRATNMVV